MSNLTKADPQYNYGSHPAGTSYKSKDCNKLKYIAKYMKTNEDITILYDTRTGYYQLYFRDEKPLKSEQIVFQGQSEKIDFNFIPPTEWLVFIR